MSPLDWTGFGQRNKVETFLSLTCLYEKKVVPLHIEIKKDKVMFNQSKQLVLCQRHLEILQATTTIVAVDNSGKVTITRLTRRVVFYKQTMFVLNTSIK